MFGKEEAYGGGVNWYEEEILAQVHFSTPGSKMFRVSLHLGLRIHETMLFPGPGLGASWYWYKSSRDSELRLHRRVFQGFTQQPSLSQQIRVSPRSGTENIGPGYLRIREVARQRSL